MGKHRVRQMHDNEIVRMAKSYLVFTVRGLYLSGKLKARNNQCRRLVKEGRLVFLGSDWKGRHYGVPNDKRRT